MGFFYEGNLANMGDSIYKGVWLNNNLLPNYAYNLVHNFAVIQTSLLVSFVVSRILARHWDSERLFTLAHTIKYFMMISMLFLVLYEIRTTSCVGTIMGDLT